MASSPIRLVVAAVAGFVIFAAIFAACLPFSAALGLEGAAMGMMIVALPMAGAGLGAAWVMRRFEERARPKMVSTLEGDWPADGFDTAFDSKSPDDEAEENAALPAPSVESAAEPDAGDDRPSPLTPSVVDELERLDGPQGGLRHTLVILGVSLFMFLGAELSLSGSLSYILYVVVVLAFHEAGHWVAMKAFGYRDMKVFFIPFFGAAVSGRSHAATGVQRAIVSLAGPMPGLVVGFVLALGNGWAWGIDMDFISLMLVINALNLLPFEPLDGGRLMNVLIYHRHPRSEAVMRAVGAAAMALGAVALEDWFLGLFAALLAASVPRSAKIALAAPRLRDRVPLAARVAQTIPLECREDLAVLARDRVLGLQAYQQPKLLATTMVALWEKAAITSPSPRATAALLIVYLATVGGLASLVILSV